jgi:ankyrin repeat protein
MTAVKHGRVEMLGALLSIGVNANDANASGRTALMAVSMYPIKNEVVGTMVRILIDAGANLELQDEDGHTALMYAVRMNCIVAADILLVRGAVVNRVNIKCETALFIGCNSACCADAMIGRLLAGGANANLGGNGESTSPLLAAMKHGYVDVCQMLVWSGAEIDCHVLAYIGRTRVDQKILRVLARTL